VSEVQQLVIDDFRGPYRWLSNFHLAEVELDKVIYPSTEHAYQAAKTLNVRLRKEFLSLTCREAKKLGGQIDLRPGWDEMKFAGWANPPRYDTKTNNLTWALNLTSSSDGHKSIFLNESIRLLGRGGVMNVTLVTEPTPVPRRLATLSGTLEHLLSSPELAFAEDAWVRARLTDAVRPESPMERLRTRFTNTIQDLGNGNL
jgi:hypothetical protein